MTVSIFGSVINSCQKQGDCCKNTLRMTRIKTRKKEKKKMGGEGALNNSGAFWDEKQNGRLEG